MLSSALMPSSSQSVERKPNKSIPGCKKPFNLPICFEIMCIFANEFGALFCVSFHPEIDPICLNQQKEELLDLKRQRADTETRERACNICLTSETKGLGHLSQSLFAPCFLGPISRPSWEGEGALAILTLIVAIISAQWPPGCPLMMVGDSAEGFLKSMKSRPQKLCCREICRQTGTGAAQHNPNVTSDSNRLTIS